MKLAPITRPNGKVYQPRKVDVFALGDGDDWTRIVVLGTHDPDVALPLVLEHAESLIREYLGPGLTIDVGSTPTTGWLHRRLHGFEDQFPSYWYEEDDEKGRASISYPIETVERSTP